MKSKRMGALIASLIINLCIGSIYAWSVFAGPLSEDFGWSASAVALTFTIANGVGPVTMILGGKLQDKYGPKWVVFVGAFMFGGGLFASGFIDSVQMLYVTYGLCMGLGLGTIYTCTIANTVKLFPDKKGFISGLTTCMYGLASVIAAPISQKLIVAYDVSTTFKILGVVYFVIVAACSQFLVKADVDSEQTGVAACENDKKWNQMLASPLFYVLLIMLLCGATSGLMIIGQASIIAQETAMVTAATAAVYVSAISIANAVGRIVWGRISDKAGRYNVLIVMFAAILLSMLILTRIGAGQGAILLVLLMAVAFCFGGFMGIFPAVTAEKFGLKNNGVNYGFMFIGFALGGYVGPKLATALKGTGEGAYNTAFMIAAAMAAAGMAIALVLMLTGRRSAGGKR